MKLNITKRAEADKCIDLIGSNQLEIKRLQDENKKLKSLFEEWAAAHPDDAFDGKMQEGNTETFFFAMVEGARALKVQSHLEREDVVQKLEEDEGMAEYVVKTFDAEAIKTDFGGSKDKRRAVEDYGLYFTNPKPHLMVEAL